MTWRCLHNPLNGRHIVVLGGTMTGSGALNATTGEFLSLGQTTNSLNYMAKMWNFTYTGHYYGNLPIDPVPGNKSMVGRLIAGEGDLAIGAFIATVDRNRMVDLSVVHLLESVSFLIPVPEVLDNRYALFKPFTVNVWVSLLIACFAVLITIQITTRPTFKTSVKPTTMNSIEVNRINAKPSSFPLHKNHSSRPLANSFYYVIGVLLSQGAYCTSPKLSTRLVAGLFCLAACVLVYGYSSLLITYVIAPNNPPLIRSVHDLLRNENIKLVVDKAKGVDLIISQSTETEGIFHRLRVRLNKYPDSRCQQRERCVSEVLNNRNNDVPVKVVYSYAYGYLAENVKKDFEASGRKQCRIQITPESFLLLRASWMLPHKSPYRKVVNLGLLRTNEAGLNLLWSGMYHSLPANCKNDKKNSAPKHTPQLSFKNLVGSFILLAIGCAVSLFIFILELVFYRLHRRGARQHPAMKRNS